MSTPYVLAYAPWYWATWTFLGAGGIVGLLAILSPRLFSRLVAVGGVWIDIDKLARKLDRRIDLDPYILRHSRLFGGLLLGAAALLLSLLVRNQFLGEWAVWTFLALSSVVGLLAILSPRLFCRFSICGNTWIDVDQLAQKLDRQIDVDPYVLRHARLFGILVLAAVLALAACALWLG